ncbi:MAG: DUF4248 domain-containing protein [Tannerellaceae bacterium]|nr:DUF4248 domain-containing protein [Tannerellaceae bacterium]
MIPEQTFQIRSYSWQELGLLYSPDISPEAASKRLRRWVDFSPVLTRSLREAGWRKGNRILTSQQVRILIRHLGEP